MHKSFEAHLRQVFKCDYAMIECFNILLLTDVPAFEHSIDNNLEFKFASIPYQAIGHPAIAPCVLLATVYGLLYQEIA